MSNESTDWNRLSARELKIRADEDAFLAKELRIEMTALFQESIPYKVLESVCQDLDRRVGELREIVRRKENGK